MVTRKDKREMEKETNFFFEFINIQRHFFKDFQKKLKKVKDPRHQSYIDYGCDVLLLMLILKNACDMESMRSMTRAFNKAECIENIKKAWGMEELEELPHYDTINNFLSRLDPEELSQIRIYMIQALLDKRSLESYRISNKYWGVIIDGTGLFTFHDKHCDHCLKKTHKDKDGNVIKTVYMHHVLEAKLVVGDMVFSIDSEFIENESEDVSKQDCELNAFYRLAPRLKATFKRLPICILGDSLYTCEEVFNLCHDYQWSYLLRFKEDRIPTISQEFHVLDQSEKVIRKAEETLTLRWVNQIAYRKRDVHVLEGILTRKKTETRFLYVTHIRLTDKNAYALLEAGRSRWKIENEGFNRQKQMRYHIEHASSHDYTAMKNHYLITQITDILMYLFEKGAKILRRVKKTAKEISSNLLESIRSRFLTDEDIIKLSKPIQVRFT